MNQRLEGHGIILAEEAERLIEWREDGTPPRQKQTANRARWQESGWVRRGSLGPSGVLWGSSGARISLVSLQLGPSGPVSLIFLQAPRASDTLMPLSN